MKSPQNNDATNNGAELADEPLRFKDVDWDVVADVFDFLSWRETVAPTHAERVASRVLADRLNDFLASLPA